MDSRIDNLHLLLGELLLLFKSILITRKGWLQAYIATHHVGSQLNVKHEQILSFDDQNASLVHLRQHLLDLLVAEVEVVFIENQFWNRMQELLERLSSSERCNEDLLLKHLDVVTKLNGHMVGKAQCIEENAKLMMALQSLKSELETNVSERRELVDYVDKRSAMWVELENCKTMAVVVEAEASREKHRQIEQLKSMLVSSEEEMDNLQSCRDELEITVIVLRSKLDEQVAQSSLPFKRTQGRSRC